MCNTIVAKDNLLCSDCWKKLSLINTYCHHCGKPLEIDGFNLCHKCSISTQNRLKGRSCTLYDEFERSMLMRLKYGDRPGIACFMSFYMSKSDPLIFEDVDYLVAVPIHFFRLLKRTYNQSLIISKHISRYKNIPVLYNTLKKSRYTKIQGHLNKQERLANVKDSFYVNKNANIQDKRILLIDDVYTSGATVKECAKVLREQGAKEVRFLTFARVKNMNN